MEAARAVMAARRVARAGVPPRGCRGTARGTEVWLARVRNGAADGRTQNFAKQSGCRGFTQTAMWQRCSRLLRILGCLHEVPKNSLLVSYAASLMASLQNSGVLQRISEHKSLSGTRHVVLNHSEACSLARQSLRERLNCEQAAAHGEHCKTLRRTRNHGHPTGPAKI